MNKHEIPRLVIAGTGSGVGKTTIVAGLLAVLKQRGLAVQSYKVGPDYIDPGYHRLASGKPAHNLDTWLVSAENLVELFATTAKGCDVAIIEGVMGLYDGGRGGISSTAAIAKQLAAPVILVLDAKAAGESIAATALGFKAYDTEVNLAGVIVNRLGSSSHKAMVGEALERLSITVFGQLLRTEALMIKERHLGLTPVTESDAAQALGAMAWQVSRDVAVDKLLEAARSAPPLPISKKIASPKEKSVRIGVAQDEAFSFYYPESLAVLETLGAELVPFSPLGDKALPVVDGLIFGGGFPEMFLPDLSANMVIKAAIGRAAQRAMPIYAECGGLMYLARQIESFDGQSFEMVGLVPAVCRMQSRLQTVGYVEATALKDNIFCQRGESLRGHEFHFSSMTVDADADFNWAFEFRKLRTGAVYPGGYAAGSVLASYLHLHFSGNQAAAARFIAKCKEFQRQREMIP
ncbi:MAG: Cobyrinic acid A,C-diamide synthase [Firmicutes bacterium]|nr:Cobyrinic acid A,C-diamide synthase [Bacillota bacterium]